MIRRDDGYGQTFETAFAEVFPMEGPGGTALLLDGALSEEEARGKFAAYYEREYGLDELYEPLDRTTVEFGGCGEDLVRFGCPKVCWHFPARPHCGHDVWIVR